MSRTITRVAGILIATTLGLSALLSGCGQKGPLYLPDETQKAQQEKKSSAN